MVGRIVGQWDMNNTFRNTFQLISDGRPTGRPYKDFNLPSARALMNQLLREILYNFAAFSQRIFCLSPSSTPSKLFAITSFVFGHVEVAAGN
jgi:hypothetical protein